MNNVTRYTMLEEADAGAMVRDVVLASDYDALAARLAEAERLLRRVYDCGSDNLSVHDELCAWIERNAVNEGERRG